MSYRIERIDGGSYDFLNEFLYEAIFIPEGVEKPPKSIIDKPELKLYIDGFGKKDDFCFAAYCNGEIIGAAWARIMNDYGHIDDETPSLAISVKEPYRSRGIGTRLMRTLLSRLKDSGYRYVSLSVQKANYAADLYRKLGFEGVAESEEELIMRLKLND